MRGEFLHSRFSRVLPNNVPNDLFGHSTPPHRACPRHTPEDSPARDPGRVQPIVYEILHPVRHWDGPNVRGFSKQVDNRPVVVPPLHVRRSTPRPRADGDHRRQVWPTTPSPVGLSSSPCLDSQVVLWPAPAEASSRVGHRSSLRLSPVYAFHLPYSRC